MIMLSFAQIIGITFGIVGAFVVASVFLYFFVIKKKIFQKEVVELQKRFSHIDGLLIGTDATYLNRIESISRSNLLYVDKYDYFLTKYKNVVEKYDKNADSAIKKLNALVKANQYKNFKNSIIEARNAVNLLEEEYTQLDKELYEVIKLEDIARNNLLSVKNKYRDVKQKYFKSASDLEKLSANFLKVFGKIDELFVKVEKYIERAEYDECSKILPYAQQIIEQIDKAIDKMPDICSLIFNVIPKKLKDVSNSYQDRLAMNLPLHHLDFDNNFANWNATLNKLEKNILMLQITGMYEVCQKLIDSIDSFSRKLDDEVEDKKIFEQKNEMLYNKVFALERLFLKMTSILPSIKTIYTLDENDLSKLESIKTNIGQLTEARRVLDNFIHSSEKKPYSVLKLSLNSLSDEFDICEKDVNDFKLFLDGLKITANEANEMIYSYYDTNNQLEKNIFELNVPVFNEQCRLKIAEVYTLINNLYQVLVTRPINIKLLKEKMNILKTQATPFFDDVMNKIDCAKKAELAIVLLNKDRVHQNDIHQQLQTIEMSFTNGEFENTYNLAISIYQKNHIESNSNA